MPRLSHVPSELKRERPVCAVAPALSPFYPGVGRRRSKTMRTRNNRCNTRPEPRPSGGAAGDDRASPPGSHPIVSDARAPQASFLRLVRVVITPRHRPVRHYHHTSSASRPFLASARYVSAQRRAAGAATTSRNGVDMRARTLHRERASSPICCRPREFESITGTGRCFRCGELARANGRRAGVTAPARSRSARAEHAGRSQRCTVNTVSSARVADGVVAKRDDAASPRRRRERSVT
jgi:hypothetical protein